MYLLPYGKQSALYEGPTLPRRSLPSNTPRHHAPSTPEHHLPTHPTSSIVQTPAMFARSKSKDRSSTRKVTPPSPSYMTNDQFGTSTTAHCIAWQHGPMLSGQLLLTLSSSGQLLISPTCETPASTDPAEPVRRRPRTATAPGHPPAAVRPSELLPSPTPLHSNINAHSRMSAMALPLCLVVHPSLPANPLSRPACPAAHQFRPAGPPSPPACRAGPRLWEAGHLFPGASPRGTRP